MRILDVNQVVLRAAGEPEAAVCVHHLPFPALNVWMVLSADVEAAVSCSCFLSTHAF